MQKQEYHHTHCLSFCQLMFLMLNDASEIYHCNKRKLSITQIKHTKVMKQLLEAITYYIVI